MHATIAAVMLASMTMSAKPDPRQFGWYSDYTAGLAEARKTGKPMMLVFRCDP